MRYIGSYTVQTGSNKIIEEASSDEVKKLWNECEDWDEDYPTLSERAEIRMAVGLFHPANFCRYKNYVCVSVEKKHSWSDKTKQGSNTDVYYFFEVVI
jgi:hypothetical protein